MWWIVAAVVGLGIVIGVVLLVVLAVRLYRQAKAVMVEAGGTMKHLETVTELLGQIKMPDRQLDRTDVG
ncbi:MAG: hypothetical protein L0G99_01800 [Propionibacteriales bacterium]|nr:hypothetical protein [Propionibacteriales bacterium]